jgi:phage tail-like protein
MAEKYSLPIVPAFRFVVSVDGEAIGAFTECALPAIEIEVEEIKEGGLNTSIHQLPGRRKAAKITLKNGVGVAQSLMDWYIKTLSEDFSRRKVTINLLDSKLKTTMTWDIQDAYPSKWGGPQLKSDENTIAIQELELICGEISITQEN